MNAVGMNTAQSTSAVAMIGPVTSRMARLVASTGLRPRPMLRSTFSTTTMASSTTMPMASTRPNSDSALSEKPSMCITAKVPISDTGTAASGMIEARQVCRNRITTSTTSTRASNRVCTTASMEPRTKMVGS
ncbi:hypothetical protein PAERUG_P45_London_17_VIM_2_12_12_04138 [Pseudomonas aeruginosa]|nr:hypothetical protein PAERUG_E5_London_17_VIM_2_12_12_04353 [Pseudomonas aeruginosa]CRR42068.1 hypothetical protein PAERUG_P45_London_17_VIM_2_12_12_04138 [Pseudomonas aeruginosa]SST12850.1 Uncharacterised protein [Acinetobacter baumannii]VTQ25573.1 Uncharacterised protein [Pseudomonas aeruginosa]